MKKIFNRILCALALPTLLLAGGCTDEETPAASYAAFSREELIVGGEGEQTYVELTGVGDWWIEVDPATEGWLSVEPASGNGDATLLVSSQPNDNAGQQASIQVRTSGSAASMLVTLDVFRFSGDDFDGKPAPVSFPYPKISQFNGWKQVGSGSAEVIYAGEEAYVCNNFCSSGYPGSSGLNNVMFNAAASWYTVSGIDLQAAEGDPFTLTFGCAKVADNAYAPFDPQELKVYVGYSDQDYVPLTFTCTEGGEWVLASTTFNLYNSQTMSLRFESAVAGIRIDDVKIARGSGEALPGAMVVTASGYHDVENTTASLDGRFVYTGAEPIEELGFRYMPETGSDYVSVPVSGVTTPFTASLTGLEEGETYVFSAYAIIGGDTTFSAATNSFTTNIDPVDMKVADVRGAYDGTDKKLPAAWVLHGRIVSDRSGGNYPVASFAMMDDVTPSSGIRVNVIDQAGLPVTHAFNVNDDVSFSLRGARFVAGATPMQINVLQSMITATPDATAATPIVIGAGSGENDYESMLIQCDNTQLHVDYFNRPWGPARNETTQSNIVYLKDNSYAVETAATATMAATLTGGLSGTVIGVKGAGNLLMPRSAADIRLTEPRIGGDPAEQVVYYEDLPSPSGNTALASYTTGRKEGQPNVTYTGIAGSKSPDVRDPGNSNNSSGYTGASGNAHIYISNTAWEGPPTGYKVPAFIQGLDTRGAKNMYITMGLSPSNGGTTNQTQLTNRFELAYSTDPASTPAEGRTYTNLECEIVEGAGATPWVLVKVSPYNVLPESEFLTLRFLFKQNNGRIDDIRIVKFVEP